jgi:pimeloyl-ACP methyl ester carboxylesterase
LSSRFTRGYRKVDVPGAGHFPHREKPADVLSALVQHIDAHES